MAAAESATSRAETTFPGLRKLSLSHLELAVPRFVVLLHNTPLGHKRPPHLDLMLETESALRTWALPHWPASGDTTCCEQLADHRLDYLTYEGSISGGRGEVTRDDEGTYSIISETSRTLVVRLDGAKLQGEITLRRISEDSAHWEATWQ